MDPFWPVRTLTQFLNGGQAQAREKQFFSTGLELRRVYAWLCLVGWVVGMQSVPQREATREESRIEGRERNTEYMI